MRDNLLRKARNYWSILSGVRQPLPLAHLRENDQITLLVQVLPGLEQAERLVSRLSQSPDLQGEIPILPKMVVGEKPKSPRARTL